jgi:hypothetical protein
MDKPALLETIQTLHPTSELSYIQLLAKHELAKQVEESINGMLSKKSKDILLSIINYSEVAKKSKLK